MYRKTDTTRALAIAAALAIVGALVPAGVGATDPVTEVTGTTTCLYEVDGVWRGDPVPGFPGSRFLNAVYDCSLDVNDDRLAGEVRTVNGCDFTVEDGTTVGECWGTGVIRNEDGAWAGVFSGTTRDEPGAKDPMELVYLGSGDYAGLRVAGSVTTNETPGIFTGQIESIE